MRGGSFLLFALIPALLALGHDAYLFYVNYAEPKGFSTDLLLKEFKFSALGFIWTSYYEEGYKMTVDSTDPATWSLIDYVLTFKAFYVGLAYAGIITLIFGVAGVVFGKGPLAMENTRFFTSNEKEVSFRSGQQSKKIDYKRK